MLTFECPTCNKKLQVADAHAGKTVQCPACKANATVPQPEAAADGITAEVPIAPVADEAVTTPENAPKSRAAKRSRDDDADDDGDRDDSRRPRKRSGSGAAAATGIGAGAVIGIVVGIVCVLSCCIVVPIIVALLVPAVSKVREAAARTQSINNLKQITLGMHNYHDTNRFLPYNGAGAAVASGKESGSWAFQILPHIDQKAYFANPQTNVSIPALMCPGRARSTAVTTGASTDYMYNLCLNNQVAGNSPSQPKNNKTTLVGIQDGSSLTIFVGHGQISTDDYSKANVAGFCDTINLGGTFGTARGSTANGPPIAGNGPPTNFARDPAGAATSNAWGGPFPQGGFMAMCDGSVRMFPYTMAGPTLGGFLTPNNNEPVVLPDT